MVYSFSSPPRETASTPENPGLLLSQDSGESLLLFQFFPDASAVAALTLGILFPFMGIAKFWASPAKAKNVLGAGEDPPAAKSTRRADKRSLPERGIVIPSFCCHPLRVMHPGRCVDSMALAKPINVSGEISVALAVILERFNHQLWRLLDLNGKLFAAADASKFVLPVP